MDIKIRGNVARDPEIKTTSRGPMVALRLGVNEGKGDARVTTWHTVFYNGDDAAKIAATVVKGDYIEVSAWGARPEVNDKDNSIGFISNGRFAETTKPLKVPFAEDGQTAPPPARGKTDKPAADLDF